jgi:penicillin V acylase-like amidase (Ntn superfamily)
MRKIQIGGIVLSFVCITALAPSGRACTTFAFTHGGATIVGKSYDWRTGHGLVMVNPRGMAKQALTFPPGRYRPAQWVSRHGSVTFNQYGREHPLGGMNEKGLVVEIMWLSSARYGRPVAGRETVNELQLIQYLLDTAGTVPEAIAHARRLQVVKVHAAVHYMACDASGTCAALEYLDGKLTVHTGAKMPARVLTNDTYAASRRALSGHKGFGGRAPIPQSRASLHRFVRAAAMTRAASRRGGASAVSRAFGVLESVRMPGYSKWQIVYEPGQGRLHFRNAGETKHVTVDARALSYSCGAPGQVIDLRGTVTGRKGVPVKARPSQNAKLIRLSFKELGAAFPPAAIEGMAAYPARATRCVTGGDNSKRNIQTKQKAKKGTKRGKAR